MSSPTSTLAPASIWSRLCPESFPYSFALWTLKYTEPFDSYAYPLSMSPLTIEMMSGIVSLAFG